MSQLFLADIYHPGLHMKVLYEKHRVIWLRPPSRNVLISIGKLDSGQANVLFLRLPELRAKSQGDNMESRCLCSVQAIKHIEEHRGTFCQSEDQKFLPEGWIKGPATRALG